MRLATCTSTPVTPRDARFHDVAQLSATHERELLPEFRSEAGAASMCSTEAALRSERMALFERKFVD